VDSDKRFVIVGLLCGFVALVVIMGYASMGNVRHVDIFWPERIKQTLEFRNVDGVSVVVGTVGNAGTNPDLIMRTGGFYYVLTVHNKDTKPHQLYVEGLDVSTKLLEEGVSDQIILRSNQEATFNYYDVADGKVLLGTITARHVIPLDELESR
jgi:threonine dehydrogenase-like Zn-dependent dehydrogenase